MISFDCVSSVSGDGDRRKPSYGFEKFESRCSLEVPMQLPNCRHATLRSAFRERSASAFVIVDDENRPRRNCAGKDSLVRTRKDRGRTLFTNLVDVSDAQNGTDPLRSAAVP